MFDATNTSLKAKVKAIVCNYFLQIEKAGVDIVLSILYIIYMLVLNLEAAAINFLHYNLQIKSVSRYAGSGKLYNFGLVALAGNDIRSSLV